jgi:hypothetical protein
MAKTCNLLSVLIAIVCSLAAVLLSANASDAAGFSGPWDSVHEPPLISNPGVKVNLNTGIDTLEIGLTYDVTCPNGQPLATTVTLTYPGGIVSATLAEPCAGEMWGAISPAKSAFAVSTTGRIGTPPEELDPASISFEPHGWSGLTGEGIGPVLYEVTNPSGVIAAGAITIIATPGQVKVVSEREGIDNFINECIDGGYPVYSKENGSLYCEIGDVNGIPTLTFHKGWPRPKPQQASTGPERHRRPERYHSAPCNPLKAVSYQAPSLSITHIHGVHCPTARAVAKAVDRFQNPHHFSVRVAKHRWTCTEEEVQGLEDPIGEVTCHRGEAVVVVGLGA